MALNANELYVSSTGGRAKRFVPKSIHPRTFDGVGGAPLLAQLTPVYKNAADNFWLPWSQTNEIQTLTFDGTGGVYTVAYDGVVSPSLTYLNAAGDTAVILAALEALPGIAPGNVTVVRGTPAGNVTIFTVTFGGALGGTNIQSIAITEAITGGGATLVQATGTAGAGSGAGGIDGFIYEQVGAQLHATDETEHNVIMSGIIDARDVPLPAGESQTLLDAALRSGMRAKGFDIVGLIGVS